MYRLFRLSLLLCGLAFVFAPHPAQAAVVFSNMPSNNADDASNVINTTQSVTVIFNVPAGPDYQVNSVQTALATAGPGTISISARLHADNGGALGAAVVDLGAQDVAVGTATYTFTPIGPAVLANGSRYWLVLSQTAAVVQTARWTGNNPAIAPAGVFTFVANGIVMGGAVYPQGPIRYAVSIDADALGVSSSVIAPSAFPACANTDGRLNSICDDPGQTAAVYCRADGSIDIYGITEGAGWLAFRVTQAEIDAVGVPAENTLLGASGNGAIRLYRLTSGEFQVNAPVWDVIRGNLPDGYVFRWPGC